MMETGGLPPGAGVTVGWPDGRTCATAGAAGLGLGGGATSRGILMSAVIAAPAHKPFRANGLWWKSDCGPTGPGVRLPHQSLGRAVRRNTLVGRSRLLLTY